MIEIGENLTEIIITAIVGFTFIITTWIFWR